uniref:Uncharacterized protein n=1 Tax=Anguilla anguilla TaxID=7936 RepID=A0A0E9SE35_ANGAN
MFFSQSLPKKTESVYFYAHNSYLKYINATHKKHNYAGQSHKALSLSPGPPGWSPILLTADSNLFRQIKLYTFTQFAPYLRLLELSNHEVNTEL